MSEANLNDSDISGSDSPISHSKKQNDNALDSPQQTHPTYLSRPKANNQVRMQASPVLSPILTKEKHILSHTFNNSKRGQTEEKVNRTLALMHKGLCKLPSHISEKLSSLRIVDLSHNKFEYFPIEVTQVSTLQILRLNFNRIKKLPAEISKLTSLEILSLSYNRLQSLPSTLPQLPALKGLHLEANYIESFGEEITGIKTLECLNIYHNRITGLPTNFKNLKRLRELRLEWLRYLGSTSCYWREDDNATGLNLLRESCEELWKNGRQTVDFIEFLKIFKDNSGEELDVMHRDNYGCTILHQACLCEDIGVIKSLTSVAPDLIDLQDYQNRTPLCYSIVKDKHKASAYLLRHGANPTKQCGADGYPIHIAAKRLNCEILRGILRLGEKVNRTDSEGNTALHHAIALLSEEPKKASQVIEELMDYGADPNIKNNEGWTPLHAAVRKRDTKALEWALSHNFATMEICGRSEVFDLNIGGGPHNWTPMHIAAYSENPEMIEVLGEAGADMFQKSLNGYTPKKVVGKPGLILKLVTKYEREFIKKQILEPHAKQTMSDSGSRERIPTQLVSNLQGTKPVNNVSRNLFAKNLESEDTNTAHEQPDLSIISTNNNTKNFVTPLVSPFHHHHGKHISTGCTPFGADTRINMHVTMTETKHLLVRRDSEDSSEILPESEILSVSPSIDELDASHPDFCGSEFNETEKTGSRTQIESDNRKILPTKNIKNKLSETLARITIRCDITNSQSSSQETLKEPSNGPVLPSEIVDSQKYANYLKYCAKSGLDFWDKQARYIEEGVLKESSSLAERLRLLSVFKVFQRSLVDYVKNNPELLSSRRNSIFSVPDRPPSFLENEFFTPVKRELSKEERYLDLPFKSLVNMFSKLKNELPANVSLKIHICRFIGDAKMTKGLEFLKGITRNTQEASLVINEAKIICKMLEGPVKPMDTEGSFIIKGFRTDLFSNQKEAPQGRNVIFSAGKGISTQGKRSSLMAIGNHQGDKGYY